MFKFYFCATLILFLGTRAQSDPNYSNNPHQQSCPVAKPTPCRESIVNVVEHVLNFVRDFPTLCWGSTCAQPVTEPPTTTAPPTAPPTTTGKPTEPPTTTAAPTTTAPPTTTQPITTTTEAPNVPVNCTRNTDVGVILDSSGSINDTEYLIAKNFVAALSRAFTTHPGNRFMLIYYGHNSTMRIHLTNNMTSSEIETYIMETPQAKGHTMTAQAIRLGVGEMKHNKRSTPVPQSLIVLTDGASTDKNASAEARVANSLNITTYTVGIGDKIKFTELVSIAGNATRVRTVDDFAGLNLYLSNISKQLCH